MCKIILPVARSLTLSLSPSLYTLVYCCLFLSQDLESKSLVDRLSTDGPVECMSLIWSANGQTLFAGYTDDLIQ